MERWLRMLILVKPPTLIETRYRKSPPHQWLTTMVSIAPEKKIHLEWVPRVVLAGLAWWIGGLSLMPQSLEECPVHPRGGNLPTPRLCLSHPLRNMRHRSTRTRKACKTRADRRGSSVHLKDLHLVLQPLVISRDAMIPGTSDGDVRHQVVFRRAACVTGACASSECVPHGALEATSPFRFSPPHPGHYFHSRSYSTHPSSQHPCRILLTSSADIIDSFSAFSLLPISHFMLSGRSPYRFYSAVPLTQA